MSIPKGLIIYTAKRHHELYPVNIKYRHYSNIISLPPRTTIQDKDQTKITKVAKITKLVRHLDLALSLYPKTTQVMRYFSKLNRIKTFKCSFVIKVLKRAFRNMKDLEQINLKSQRRLADNFGNFKHLLLQRCLQKLTVDDLYCTQDMNDLAAFTKFVQVANRRKCWPHLNSFGIDMKSFEHRAAHRNFVRGPGGNLLKFLQVFKACESLYKCAHFQLEISNGLSNPSPEECAAVDEIMKMKLPLSQVSLFHGEHFTSLFQAAQDLKDLQSLKLVLSHGHVDSLEMNSLKELPNLQDLTLVLELDDVNRADFCYFALEKLQGMTNLRSLSIDLYGDPSEVGDLLCEALSNLTQLTCLFLRFLEAYQDEEEDEVKKEKLNWPWLKPVFQAISKMKKLKTLHLEFLDFDRDGSSGIFKSLCQALGNLTQLFSFHLVIGDAKSIQDEDLLTLASSLTRLTRMKSLYICLGRLELKFKSSTFVVLMDSIVNNLKILSELFLNIDFGDVTKQYYQMIMEGIRQMKYLNRIIIENIGQVERGLDSTLLNAEIRKRMTGYVFGP